MKAGCLGACYSEAGKKPHLENENLSEKEKADKNVKLKTH